MRVFHFPGCEADPAFTSTVDTALSTADAVHLEAMLGRAFPLPPAAAKKRIRGLLLNAAPATIERVAKAFMDKARAIQG